MKKKFHDFLILSGEIKKRAKKIMAKIWSDSFGPQVLCMVKITAGYFILEFEMTSQLYRSVEVRTIKKII